MDTDDKQQSGFPGLASAIASWKGGFISTLELLRRKAQGPDDSCISLLIPGAVLQCKLADIQVVSSEQEKGNRKLDNSIALGLYEEAWIKRLKENPETQLCDNTAILHLQDVTLRPLGSLRDTVTMNEFFIFADQIIGVSLSSAADFS